MHECVGRRDGVPQTDECVRVAAPRGLEGLGQQLNAERIKLAAMQIPSGMNEEIRTALRQTVNECFVFGFRRVMLTGAALALASSLVSALMIRRQ